MLGARRRFMEIRSQSRSSTMALSEPVLSGPGAGRTVTHGAGTSTELKLAGEQSGGDWAVVEWRVRAGDEPPMHTHTREDEALYVLEGAITAYVGDQTIEGEVEVRRPNHTEKEQAHEPHGAVHRRSGDPRAAEQGLLPL